MDVVETEVLVVGAGPVGVTLGLLLADLGVSTMVIDKRTTVSVLPRARGLNARGAEILRMVGVEADVIRRALPVRPELQVRQDLAHEPTIVQATGGDTFTEVSPCEGIAISQDVLESVLREHLQRRDRAELRTGWRLTRLSDADPGSTCRSFVSDAQGATREIRSRFVVGADGWRSDVRSQLGIATTGDDDLGRMRSVRFAARLSAWLGDPPPAFIRLSGIDGFLLATHPGDRWVLIVPERDGLDAEPGRLVGAALGVDVTVEVLDDTRWVAAVRQAVRFTQGNGMLAGDAAHRVTPAGATGITSGMADAANLAWKLAGTLQGWGGPHLLGSYGQEREPVATWIGGANLRLWTDSQQGRQTPVELRWLEFGYRYRSAIIAPAAGGLDDIDLASSFTPRAEPGDRAPHVRLSDGRSTIDLAGRQFTLLTADDEVAAWSRAADLAGATVAAPLAVVSDPHPQVGAAFHLEPGQAVLIRPDGHLAWRSGVPSPAHDRIPIVRTAIARATGW